MAADLFVGRDPVIAAFATAVASLRHDARVFKGGGVPTAPKRVFVLTGVSGIGKSELAERLIEQLSDGNSKGPIRILKDWGYGPEPDAKTTLIERLAQVIDDQSPDVLRNFIAYRQVSERALATLGQQRAEHPEEWQQAEDRARADDATAKGAADLARGVIEGAMPQTPGVFVDAAADFAKAGTYLAFEAQRHFTAWLRSNKRIDEQARVALDDPSGYLARALVGDLRRDSARRPRVIWLDTCEQIRQHLSFLTAELIAPLLGSRVIWVLSGQWLESADPARPIPDWARPIASSMLIEELQPFTDDELADLVLASPLEIPGPERAVTVRRLRDDTHGIPLLANMAVQDRVWLGDDAATAPVPHWQDSQVGRPSVGDLLRGFTDRLLGRLADRDILLLCVLAMTGGHTASPAVNAVCKGLDLDAEAEYARLERSVFMLRAGKLHDLVASYLRDRLRRDDAFASYRAKIATRYVDWARDRWLKAARRRPDFSVRFDDEDALDAAFGYCAASFWFSFADGCRETFQLWSETLLFRDRRAARLLLAAASFASVEPPQRLERQLLRMAAALCVGELGVPGCQTWWYEYPNAAALISVLRGLAKQLDYPERVLFALDLCFGYLAAMRGIGGSDLQTLQDRHAALVDDAREGLQSSLGAMLAMSARRVAFAPDGNITIGRAGAAASAFHAAARLAPGIARVQLDAAKVLFCAGKEEAAKEAARKAIALAERDPRIVLHAADVLWKLGDGHTVMDAVGKLALIRPQDFAVLYYGFWHYLRPGAFSEAREWLSRALGALSKDGSYGGVSADNLAGDLAMLNALDGGSEVPDHDRVYPGFGGSVVKAFSGDLTRLLVDRDEQVDPAAAPVDAARGRLYQALTAHLVGDPAQDVSARLTATRELAPSAPGYTELIVCLCDVPVLGRAICARLDGHTDCADFYDELEATRNVVERLPWRRQAVEARAK